MQLPHTRVACRVYSALADSAEQKEVKAFTETLVDIVEQLKLIVPGASMLFMMCQITDITCRAINVENERAEQRGDD